jgi:hypothetical protein
MQAAAQDRGQRPPFGFADDPSAEAEAIARRVAEALAALQAELTDARCGCSALGLVCDVLPRMPEALAERGVALGSVVGVWAVPAAVLDTASRCSQSPWPSVRQRLKPYLAFDLWLELQDDVFAGKGVDWGEMALSEASVVVVKHTLPLRAAGSRLAREAWVAICSGRLRRAVVIAARQHLHRRRMVELAAWAWPFRWAWLLGWVAGMTAVVASRLLAAAIIAAHLNPPSMPDTSVDASHQPLDASLDTSTQPPVASPGRAALAWRELVGLFLANLTLLAYAIRGRAPYAMAMGEAVALKKSGTVALRLKDAAAAAQQYTAGARRAGELRGEGWWWLNGRAVAAADTLRAACWNNAAAAHLQQNNWAEAEAAAAAALGVPGLGSAAAAKARYRRAVARASVRDMDGAREDLLIAESLAPGDRHVDALVRMLQLEQARSKAEGGGGGGGSEPTASPNSGAMPLPPSVGGVVSSAAAPAAGDGVRAGAASRGGAAPVSGDGAALTLGVTVAPVQKFRWAKDWFEAKLVSIWLAWGEAWGDQWVEMAVCIVFRSRTAPHSNQACQPSVLCHHSFVCGGALGCPAAPPSLPAATPLALGFRKSWLPGRATHARKPLPQILLLICLTFTPLNHPSPPCTPPYPSPPSDAAGLHRRGRRHPGGHSRPPVPRRGMDPHHTATTRAPGHWIRPRTRTRALLRPHGPLRLVSCGGVASHRGSRRAQLHGHRHAGRY